MKSNETDEQTSTAKSESSGPTVIHDTESGATTVIHGTQHGIREGEVQGGMTFKF